MMEGRALEKRDLCDTLRSKDVMKNIFYFFLSIKSLHQLFGPGHYSTAVSKWHPGMLPCREAGSKYHATADLALHAAMVALREN